MTADGPGAQMIAGRVGTGVFNRLSKMDLPRRLDAVAPRPLTRFAVAFALLAAIVTIRVGIDAAMPGVTPFALLYPAVLLATILAGWMSGAMLMAMGGLLVWYIVLEPTRSFELSRPADAVSLTSSKLVLTVQAPSKSDTTTAP